MTKISDALTFGLTIRESANDGSDFTNPAADYRRLFLGEDGQLHTKDSAGAVTGIGASGGGGLLAVVQYATASADAVFGQTASTSFVDVDATNASITFTAPTSTNVLVRLTAPLSCTGRYLWGLREASSDIATPFEVAGSAIYSRFCASAALYLAGISAGSHTYKWSHRVTSGVGSLYLGNDAGDLVMEVWAAP